jgi:uncharacterized protein
VTRGEGAPTKQRAKRPRGQSGPKCPICGKPTIQAYRPFCSKACADIDLSRWLGGKYVVPGAPAGREDEAEE